MGNTHQRATHVLGLPEMVTSKIMLGSPAWQKLGKLLHFGKPRFHKAVGLITMFYDSEKIALLSISIHRLRADDY